MAFTDPMPHCQNSFNEPFWQCSGDFESYCFKYLLWDARGQIGMYLPCKHPIIAVWNNRIWNDCFISIFFILQFQNNISILHPRMDGIETSRGGGSLRPKHLWSCIKVIEFPEGWGLLGKIPSILEVLIFSGTAHYEFISSSRSFFFHNIYCVVNGPNVNSELTCN